MYRFLNTILFFLLFSTLGYGQEEELVVEDDSTIEIHEINNEHLENYRSDKDFIYVEIVREESFLDKIWQWLKNRIQDFFEWLFGVDAATGILKFIFNVFPYLILALLIFLLVKFFLNVNSNVMITGQVNKPTMQFGEDEQIIMNEDITAFINKAIKQKNYRLAIRYYYLLSLKYLSDKHIIDWLPQKTNEDYIKEIEHESLQNDFKDATWIYDYIWYGEFAIDEIRFNSLKSTFETLNNSIKSS
jgi:large-conductance mechanosensitive channel